MVDQMKQAAGSAQDLPALRTAMFMRADRAEKAMQCRQRIVLAPQLQACLQGDGLSSKKEQEPPQRGAVQSPLIDLLFFRRRDVALHSATRRHGLLIRELVLFQVGLCQGEQTGAGVAPVGQQESQASQ